MSWRVKKNNDMTLEDLKYAHYYDNDERYFHDTYDHVYGDYYFTNKSREEILYDKEVFNWQQDIMTMQKMQDKLDMLPEHCLGIIMSFECHPTAPRTITRCQETFKKCDTCPCMYCNQERRELAKEKYNIKEMEILDYYDREPYDW